MFNSRGYGWPTGDSPHVAVSRCRAVSDAGGVGPSAGMIIVPSAPRTDVPEVAEAFVIATHIWDAVLGDSERLQWPSTPLKSVGPLRFGMTQTQVRAAVDGTLLRVASQGYPDKESWADFCPVSLDGSVPPGIGPAVTVYYHGSAGLACVVIDARRGPQVTLDGLPLTGQVPSRLENEFTDYLESWGKELWYGGHDADPYSPELGLMLRAQRVSDVVLSRPVLVGAQWADRFWDAWEGPIPQREWHTFR